MKLAILLLAVLCVVCAKLAMNENPARTSRRTLEILLT